MTTTNNNDFYSADIVKSLTEKIAANAKNIAELTIMHVCGTHEHEINKFALRKLLPANITLVSGPGCPVCITPAGTIATAMELASFDKKNTLCCYGDIMRVPTTKGSLLDAKSNGADIKMIFNPEEAVKVAKENPQREVIFFSIGFETTAAPVAVLLQKKLPKNFSIYTSHRYVPEGVKAIAKLNCEIACNGDNCNRNNKNSSCVKAFLLPGHAAVITGAKAYRFLEEEKYPCAIAGFTPTEILHGISEILEQYKSQEFKVGNCYKRFVKDEGNIKAQNAISEVFTLEDGLWRGVGTLPLTALTLNEKYRHLSALKKFNFVEEPAEEEMPGCSCHLVILGLAKPEECTLFKKHCTPDTPKGPCMVGNEGTCRSVFMYGDSL